MEKVLRPNSVRTVHQTLFSVVESPGGKLFTKSFGVLASVYSNERFRLVLAMRMHDVR